MSEVIFFLLGVIAGWGIQHWYARKSSQELLKIFRSFAAIAEENKLVEWQRDKVGNITTGRIIRMAITPGAAQITISGQAVGVALTQEKKAEG